VGGRGGRSGKGFALTNHRRVLIKHMFGHYWEKGEGEKGGEAMLLVFELLNVGEEGGVSQE